MDHKWYIVHAQSGREDSACKALKKRLAHDGLDFISDAFIPTYKETIYKDGKKKQVTRKSFPGYIYIHMELTKEAMEYCLQTPYISQFVRQGTSDPRPVEDVEVNHMIEGEESSSENGPISIDFELGQKVLIVDGPFNNFTGTIKAMNSDKRKISVNVEIFGRITPVEIDYFKVKKC